MSPLLRSAGFTLMELLVVIAIAAILVGIGVPSFRSVIQSAQSREAATAFYGGLARARSEAIARNRVITVCASNPAASTPTCANSNTWENGWIVYQPGVAPNTIDALQVQPPLPDALRLRDSSATTGMLTFDASGRATSASVFTLCRNSTPDTNGRRVVVSRSGRVALEQQTCS